MLASLLRQIGFYLLFYAVLAALIIASDQLPVFLHV